ncbi:MAG: HEAT repeat domain-containing protein [Caldisericia bacterium]|nr:HEAT repeat domain-containing protein [Caldisericia bacterium]MDD4614969.1 HEAT repeat domain-containing protein [Caldisericia bacterium]
MHKIIIGTVILVSIVVGFMVAFVLLRKYLLQIKTKKEKEMKQSIFLEIEDKLFSLAPEEFKSYFNDPKKRQYIYDILKELVEENGYDFHGIFDEMDFTQEMIDRVRRNADRQALKDLSLIKSPTSYQYLLELLQSNDIELVYRAGYALSYISLEAQQKKEVIDLLLKTAITKQRLMEIITTMQPSLNLLMEELSVQTEQREKIILLNAMKQRVIGYTTRFRFLEKKLRIQNQVIIDQLKSYVEDTEEVSIAAIDVISDTKQTQALDIIIHAASTWKNPLVLAAIADCCSKFPSDNRALALLYHLAQHENYWVRLASFESLSRMGEEGYRKIFVLSMNSEFLSKYPSTYYLIYQIISEIPNMSSLIERFKKEQYSVQDRAWNAS